jgi:hypothetical protein
MNRAVVLKEYGLARLRDKWKDNWCTIFFATYFRIEPGREGI